ncbi:hypothetical protein D3C76_1182770 [compost metagenome]
MTRRNSSGERCAELTLVIGVLARLKCSRLMASWAPLRSTTIRSGAVRMNKLCCTGPLRSNTRRVLSGARQIRTPRTSEAARASTLIASSSHVAAHSALKRISNTPHFLIAWKNFQVPDTKPCPVLYKASKAAHSQTSTDALRWTIATGTQKAS